MDSGEGLLLKGDGEGGFASQFGHQSGIRVYGEQRGSAVGDLNGDGRSDLIVAQSKARPRLYLNTLGQTGLRLSLAGPAANPLGQGATVRAVFDAADRDRSGFIDKPEFIALLAQLGILTGADADEDAGLLDDELYTADEDGNESVDAGEFLRWYRERGEQLGRRRVQLDETGRIVEATLLDG